MPAKRTAVLEELLSHQRRSLGEENVKTQQTADVLASAYAYTKRVDECRKLLSEQREAVQKTREGVSLADWEADASWVLLKMEASRRLTYSTRIETDQHVYSVA